MQYLYQTDWLTRYDAYSLLHKSSCCYARDRNDTFLSSNDINDINFCLVCSLQDSVWERESCTQRMREKEREIMWYLWEFLWTSLTIRTEMWCKLGFVGVFHKNWVISCIYMCGWTVIFEQYELELCVSHYVGQEDVCKSQKVESGIKNRFLSFHVCFTSCFILRQLFYFIYFTSFRVISFISTLQLECRISV